MLLRFYSSWWIQERANTRTPQTQGKVAVTSSNHGQHSIVVAPQSSKKASNNNLPDDDKTDLTKPSDVLDDAGDAFWGLGQGKKRRMNQNHIMDSQTKHKMHVTHQSSVTFSKLKHTGVVLVVNAYKNDKKHNQSLFSHAWKIMNYHSGDVSLERALTSVQIELFLVKMQL